MKIEVPSFKFHHWLRRHVVTCLVLFGILLFWVLAYWMYHYYISTSLTKNLFLDFSFSITGVLLLLSSFTFIREIRLKDSRKILYKVLVYIIFPLMFLLTERAFFLSLTVQERIVYFFTYGVEKFGVWILALLKSFDVCFISDYSTQMSGANTTFNLMVIATLIFCLIIVTLLVFPVDYLSDRSEQAKPQMVKPRVAYCYSGGTEKRTSRNVSYGLFYKPLP